MPNDQIRMSVVGNIYHQVPGLNPTSFSLRCKKPLATEEETYLRSPPKPVVQDWEFLSLGWLNSCSMVCIRNLEKFDEDKPLVSVIELGTDEGSISLRIPPGMVTIIYPVEKLYIRCLSGSAKYTVYALPE